VLKMLKKGYPFRGTIYCPCYVISYNSLECYTKSAVSLRDVGGRAAPLGTYFIHSAFALSLASASRAPIPHTNSSTSRLLPIKVRSAPHTGVSIGTNIATRSRYAAYPRGYLLAEMASVKRVEEMKSRQSASEGESGTRARNASESALSSAETGTGVPRKGMRGMRLSTPCTCNRSGVCQSANGQKRAKEGREGHTQIDCSAKKFGCRLQDHRPRVQKPRAASALVHARRAPGQCARTSYVPCFHAWYAYCWLSAVNSNAMSPSAMAARTPSEKARGLGWVAAINAGVAIRSRRAF
jgi:hypothetical protein